MSKFSKYILLASLLIPILFLSLLHYDNTHLKKVDIHNIIEKKEEIMFNLDNSTMENRKIILNGWALEKGTPTVYYINHSVLIQNIEIPQLTYQLNTTMVERNDLNTHYTDLDYKNSGFSAKGNINTNFKQGTYEILILFNDTEQEFIFRTNTFINIKW